MSEVRGVIGLVGCGAGGAGTIGEGFVRPAVERGWQVTVTLTPTAGVWLAESGERERLEELTGFTVRDQPRLPSEPKPHPPADCVVVAPASANTVVKLAVGIADNQALTKVVEAIGDPATPVVVFPRVNAAHVRHPAWPGHLAALRAGGVHLVYGPDVWPLEEPGTAPPRRPLPWPVILDLVERVSPAR